MFQVGDKIFYPMHGAGVIQSLEEKEFLGEKHLYFEVNMLLKDLDIMVPVEKMSTLGIRRIVEKETMQELLGRIFEDKADYNSNAGQRQKENLEKLRSGDLNDLSEVIRDLWTLSKTRVLGSSDKIMLDTAKQVLVSEIQLVMGIGAEQASEMLKQACSRQEAVCVQGSHK